MNVNKKNMGLFKKNPFGHNLFLKKWLIRILAVITHKRYRGFNTIEIEGSDIIRKLPAQNVLFGCNSCKKSITVNIKSCLELGKL